MKRAIVLAGGGSKGAYQIGAWKALRELNITFDIVTGTSIGAVNGAMLVQDDFEKAYEFWKCLSVDQVFNNVSTIKREPKKYRKKKEPILPLVKDFISNKGADITPFKEGLECYLDEARFMESEIDFGLMTVSFPNMVPVEVTKKKMKPGYLKEWVLASSSCFPAFPVCKIDEAGYIDGGYYDNMPIDTAFRMGAEEVIAIALKSPAPTKKYEKNPLVKIIEPSHSLGNFLAFESDSIANNLNLGYNDTMKAFHKLCGSAYTFYNVSDQAQYEEMIRKIMIKILHVELDKDFESARFGRRSDNGKSEVEEILKSAKEGSFFTCFILFLENYMKLLGYDYYKIYDIEQVLDEIRSEPMRFKQLSAIMFYDVISNQK